jgi:hypothetical protein
MRDHRTQAGRLDVVGERFERLGPELKSSIKAFWAPGLFFEELDIAYVGVVDGHDVPALRRALSEALEAETSSGKAEAVVRTVFRLAEEWPEFPQFIREAGRLGPEVIERFAAELETLRLRALAFLANGMQEGQIREQDPALLLFTLYTAVVGSLTEAGVLRAVVGEDESRTALHRREEEVVRFVLGALAPSEQPEPTRAAGTA